MIIVKTEIGEIKNSWNKGKSIGTTCYWYYHHLLYDCANDYSEHLKDVYITQSGQKQPHNFNILQAKAKQGKFLMEIC